MVDSFGSSEFAVIVVREDGTPAGSIGKPIRASSIYNPDTADGMRGRAFRRARRPDQLRRRRRRTGQHPGCGAVHRLLQRSVRHGRADAARHVLVGRFGLPRRRRLDLSRRAHRRLDAGRRREPGGGTDRADSAAAAPGQPGRGLRGARRPSRRPGDGGAGAARRDAVEARRFREFLAAQPDLSPKAWPRYVRINEELPATATNKILKRRARSPPGVSAEGGVLWTRAARGTTYSPTVENADDRGTSAATR